MPTDSLAYAYHGQAKIAPGTILLRKPGQRLFGPGHRLENFPILTSQKCPKGENFSQLRDIVRISPFLFCHLEQMLYTLFSMWKMWFLHEHENQGHGIVQAKIGVTIQFFFWQTLQPALQTVQLRGAGNAVLLFALNKL